MRISVTDLRSLVETTLDDTELENIITIANKQVNSIAGTATDDKLFLAELYFSASFLLRRMKTNGELPDLFKAGEVSQNVKIDDMILNYEKEAQKLIRQYQFANEIDWENKELPGDY